VRVRSLRTQQRTDSQCQLCLALGFAAAFCGGGWSGVGLVLMYKFSS